MRLAGQSLPLPSRLLLWLVLLYSALWPFAAGAQRASFEHSTDRLIVKWKANTPARAQIRSAPDRRVSAQHLLALSARADTPLVPHRAMSGDAQVLRLQGRRSLSDVRAIAAKLATLPDIEYAVPDQRRFAAVSPNDGYFVGGLQKGLNQINLPAAWDLTTGDPALVVAVIDTGVLPHSDLAGRLLPGYDFISDPYIAGDGDGRDTDAADPGDWVSPAEVADMNSPFDAGCLSGGTDEAPSSWHGTGIAGIIAANGNNTSFMAGINWASKVLPVRVLGKCGGFDSDIVDGMRWAAGLAVPNVPANPNPARVLNLSLGGPGSCPAPYRAAISEIGALGAVVIAAAGNDASDYKDFTPGGCDGLIAVGAFTTDFNGNFIAASYSNFGIATDANLFAMPGNNVYSLADDGGRGPLGDAILPTFGTSGASAHMSGLVSLMLSANPSLTPALVLQMLRDTSTSIGAWAGSGKPDAKQAIGKALVYSPAKTPVSMEITGQASVFSGKTTPAYVATVTWSDASSSQVYPAWSVGVLVPGGGVINPDGTLRGGFVSADSAVTVQASFTQNGATVNASKTVDVLANLVLSAIIGGPSIVDVRSVSPALYSFTLNLRDGSSIFVAGGGGNNSNWTVTAGTIEANGAFRPGAPGPATITLNDSSGGVGTFDLTVIDSSVGPAPVNFSCASESTAGLVLDEVHTMLAGNSADLIPLCDGKVLVMDQNGQTIDLVDVRTGSNDRSWSFAARPRAMQLDAGTGKLFVSFYAGTQVASVDFATNLVSYLNVTGQAGALANGEDGQMFVLHWPQGSELLSASVSIFDTASGALLNTRGLGKPADKLFYSKPLRILIAANFNQRASFDYAPATQTVTLRDFLFDAGIQTAAVSPDGMRIVVNGRELAFNQLTRSLGSFPGSMSFDFSADGRRLVTGNTSPLDPDLMLMLFSADTHALQRSWTVPAGTGCSGNVQPKYSPSGAFIYGVQRCGSGFGRLIWIARQPEPSPDEFPFQSQVGVAPGTLATSNAVALAGFSGQASVGVAGGEYSVNGQAFTAAPGTALPGQTIAVRTTASAQASGVASVTVTVGATPSTFLVATGAALAATWWDGACASEADLGNATLAFVDIEPASDMIPLCDGRLLIGNTKLNRIQLYDLRAGGAIRAWQLAASPARLQLVPGTSLLIAATDSSSLARVDLATGAVGQILVGGRVFDVTTSEPGEVIAASQAFPSANTLFGDTLTRHNIATGAELERSNTGNSINPSLVSYDAPRHLLYAGDGTHSPSRLARMQGFNILASSIESAVGSYAHDIVLSPDGTRLAYPGEGGTPDLRELDPQNLATPRGKWRSGPWPRTAAFNAAGSKFLVGSERDIAAVNGIEMFDVATRNLERYWLLPHCQEFQNNILVSKLRRARFSPSGAYAVAIEDCGGLFARVFWVRTDAPSTMPKPDPVGFTPQTGVPFSQEIISNTIKITGLGGQWLPISVENGSYQIAGQFTAFNGFLKDGDQVRVKNVSWFAAGVKNTTTLNIGGTLFAFDVTTGSSPTDTSPDPFSLVTLKQQPVDTLLTSNTVTVKGITAPTPISIIGGSYSINGGAYTTAAGMVTNGQTVTVRVTSPNALNTSASAILTIGNTSSAFTVATGAFDNTPDDFSFGPRRQPARNAWVESSPLAVAGLGGPALASVAGGEFRVGAGAFSATPLVVQPGDSVTMRTMNGATLGATSTAALTIGTRSGTFTATVSAPLRDHDGNGKSDVFWKHSNTQTYVWQMNGAAIANAASPASTGDANWQVTGLGDFDGDGRTDVLFRHAVSGATFMWQMNGTAVAGTGSPGTVADLEWKVEGTGDFDGDGKSDLLWMHTDGTVQIWLMNGATASSKPTVATLGAASGWAVQGVGDFNGDGKSDILWKHANGQVVIWMMNGASIASAPSVTNVGPDSPTAWQVKGVGDFNGDGKADILWRNDDIGGVMYIWIMNGAVIASAVNVTGVGTEAATGWIVKSIGDYNGDGRADIFWKNDILPGNQGITYVWLMGPTGTSITTATSVTGVGDFNWQVQNPK